jgi:hypothetical protein
VIFNLLKTHRTAPLGRLSSRRKGEAEDVGTSCVEVSVCEVEVGTFQGKDHWTAIKSQQTPRPLTLALVYGAGSLNPWF